MLDLVVPVYAASEHTEAMAKAALERFRETTDGRVIVVDNGTEHDRSALFGGDPYILLRENIGYAGGVNCGLETTDADVLAIGSIDVFVEPGWQAPMVAAALEHGGIASPAAWRSMYGTPTGDWEQPGCAYWGGLFVMPRVVLETIGPLDDQRFRMRHSDTDYAVRAARAGLWVGRVPEVVVEHRDPSTSTLFMDRATVAEEYGRLFEVHGVFDPYGWTLEDWR